MIGRLEQGKPRNMGKNFCWKGLSRREMNLRTGTKTLALVGRTGILAGLHPETRMRHSVSGIRKDLFRTISYQWLFNS